MRWDEPAPSEHAAEDRSWEVVRAAWAEQPRHTYPGRSRRRPLVAIAAAAVAVAVVAAAFSSPGRAVLRSLQHAVRGEKNASPALYRLPTVGTLLVQSAPGTWVVHRDGSKRLLAGYHDAVWSPHGYYLAAVRGHELRALEPNGAVHWSLARRGPIRFPRWSFEGYRIAYFAGPALRVINGDGTGDHVLVPTASRVPPAWKPRSHVLAYVDARGQIELVNVDRPSERTLIRSGAIPRQLEWAPNGRTLIAVLPRGITIFKESGSVVSTIAARNVASATISPDGTRVAFVEATDRQSSLSVSVNGKGPVHRVFTGAGRFGAAYWAPDGRWLVLDWRGANQWLFIRSARVRKIDAISGITGTLGPDSMIAGWCCS